MGEGEGCFFLVDCVPNKIDSLRVLNNGTSKMPEEWLAVYIPTSLTSAYVEHLICAVYKGRVLDPCINM